MIFDFIKQHSKQFNVLLMCRILRVSRSGYYKYLNTKKSKRDLKNEALTKVISDIYLQYKKRYGCRGITAELRSRGIKVNHKHISRLMKKLGYAGDYPRKKRGSIEKLLRI